MTSPTWTEDEQYFIWMGQVRIPKAFDPTSKTAVILLGPEGGIAEIPALVKGDPGQPANLDETINFTALAHDDPTVDSATFTTLDPGSSTTPPLYRLNLALHKGSPGAAGTSSILSASDITGTATDGYIVAKKAGEAKAQWVPQRVGGQYWPAVYANTSGVDGQNRTLASIPIPAQPFDYRIRVHAQCIIAGTANTRVDLIARLNNAQSGDIVGRGFGLPGAVNDRVSVVSGVAAGSAATVGKVAAGAAATVFLRAEQQASTTDAYTTSAATTMFMVEVAPTAVTVSGS